MMSWPFRLRALSFAVTMGVTIAESVTGSIPVALVLWYFNVASISSILEVVILVVAVVSLSISIYSHVRPADFTRRATGESSL